MQINADGDVEVEFFDDFGNVKVAAAFFAVVLRESRNKPDKDVLHDECAEFAVRDVEDELHFLVRIDCVDVVCSRGRVAALNDGIEVAQSVGDELANHLAKVGCFEIDGLATQTSEVEIDVLTFNVNR